MFTKFVFALSAVLIASPLVIRIHIKDGHATVSTEEDGQANISAVGAAFFMTNDPQGNSIVANQINSDGTLSFIKTTATTGKGMSGINNEDPAKNVTEALDGLFSQDSVIASPKGDRLFAVNAGSNSVSAFAVDPANPSSITLVQTVPSGGEFPMSLAFSESKNMLCALNGGQKNGVQCFTSNQHGLTPIGNFLPMDALVKQTTPPVGPLGSFSDILFNKDSSQLLVSVKGNPPAKFMGFVASMAVSSTGLLGTPQVNIPTGSVAPFSMSLVPRSDSVFFTDAGVGAGVTSLGASGKQIEASSTKIDGQGATCWSDFSSRTKSMFVTDIKTSMVTEMSISKNNATVITQYALSGNTIDMRIGALPTADFLYVITPGDLAVQVMTLEGGQGSAKLVQKFVVPAEVKMTKVAQGMALIVPSKSNY